MKNIKQTHETPQNELVLQKKYIEDIKKINEKQYAHTGRQKLCCIVNFGCQMNARDSEKLSGMLHEMGYVNCGDEKKADFIIYNTCCVRENAEKKVFGKLGYLKNLKTKKKDLVIAVCGCMMQEDTMVEKIKKQYQNVDIIFGTFNIYKLPQLFYTFLDTGGTVIDIWKEHKEIVEDLPSQRKYKFKASVNIMYGCDNFCSYCIVPYVRGRERSREPQEILREIENLAKDSVKEITLLGQNVNSYGKNLKEEYSFAKLLREINKIDGIERIRFMTSHPKDLSLDLVHAIRDCEKICKHIHLPVQSGSSRLLESMNRKYTKEQYLQLTDAIKKEIPSISITTDMIVGFPGETEEDFYETLDVVRHVKFSSVFTFIYSKRIGTPASQLPNQIDEAVVKKRFNKLIETINPIIYTINKSQVGKTFDVLVESVSPKEESLLSGRTDNNSIVHFKGHSELIGQIVPVKIIENKTFYLIGEEKSPHDDNL